MLRTRTRIFQITIPRDLLNTSSSRYYIPDPAKQSSLFQCQIDLNSKDGIKIDVSHFIFDSQVIGIITSHMNDCLQRNESFRFGKNEFLIIFDELVGT